MTAKKPSTTAACESAPKRRRPARYVLRLYVAGATSQSARAITMIKALCEEYLKGRYDLEIVDLHQQPDRARDAQIVAVPTLVKALPLPVRRLTGDLSDRGRVLGGLDLAGKKHDRKKRQA